MVVVIVSYCCYRRKLERQNKRDTDNHYEMQPNRRQGPNSGILNNEGFEEYAQLDSSKRVPINANYQSLVKTRDQIRIGRCDNHENIQRHVVLNMHSSPRNGIPNDDQYEEVQ